MHPLDPLTEVEIRSAVQIARRDPRLSAVISASKGDDGLAVWAARDRAIRKEDIVLWINLGMHHLTRAEDIPLMPMIWHSFTLRPHNFFGRNPAIDLRNDSPAP